MVLEQFHQIPFTNKKGRQCSEYFLTSFSNFNWVFSGAAKMVLESGKHTGQLKDEVTSPGGTTIRAIHAMERAGIRGIMMDAVQASAERATELGSK